MLRDEAGKNYGLHEEFQEEEARERMGPLAEPTPAMIRNRGAAKRKKTGRVEAEGAGRRETTARGAGEEDARGEEGDVQQQLGEGEASEENMEVTMEAVAEAISQAE